ncbi:MAG: acetylxylan esterase [Candidatus Firestonebacteria bacterium]
MKKVKEKQDLRHCFKMPDIESFWKKKVEECRKKPFQLTVKEVKQPLKSMKVFKMSYRALDGEKIIAFKLLPAQRTSKKIPFLVHIHGFMGRKGFPFQYAHWIEMGIGVLAADYRGQGGETKNNCKYKSGIPNKLMTLGILDKNEFYLGKIYLDTLRTFFLTKSFKETDSGKIIIEGGSQGGGATVAVSGILGKEVFAAMADVPSYSQILCRIREKTGSFSQIEDYLNKHPGKRKQILENMSYFDNINLAEGITCPIICSVGLADPICPPKNFFPVYAKISSKKELRKYPGAGHEGGGRKQENEKINWLGKKLA